MRRIVLLSALAITFAVTAHAEKAGAGNPLKAKCQAQWAALNAIERKTWTPPDYIAACMAGKPVPVHGGPQVVH